MFDSNEWAGCWIDRVKTRANRFFKVADACAPGASESQYPVHSFVLMLLIAVSIVNFSGCANKTPETKFKEFTVELADVQKVVQANGVIEPRNRVQILPPVAGRIEELIKDEGQVVEKGQPLAFMSSTDRAAIIDAARNRGAADLAYWEKIYKTIPILSPVQGKVILRNVVPGQTISPATVLFEVSDVLVANAYVDETDMANVRLGQRVLTTVDAYPDQSFAGQVARVKQSSQLVNNVNVYPVQVQLLNPPSYLRSGMVANLKFVIQIKKQVPALPVYVLQGKENSEVRVLVKRGETQEKIKIQTGIADENHVEIIAGLKPGDVVHLAESRLSGPKTNSGPLSMGRRPSAGGRTR
jgi:macrolide-specific efflux system membrane fusion protein